MRSLSRLRWPPQGPFWPAAMAKTRRLANAKANQPVPPKLIAAMTEKDMDLQSPILIRLFKQEAEVEVWKQEPVPASSRC